MTNKPIVMPNDGLEREEFGVEWDWPNGGRSFAGGWSRASAESFIADPPSVVSKGWLTRRTITTSPWARVASEPGVLRLDQIDVSATYNDVKIVELGDGIVEGYPLAVFTADPELAKAAARAYLAAEDYVRPFEFRHPEKPVRWWLVFDNCGCGRTCPHEEDEDGDVEHKCEHLGLPPCLGESSWVGKVCDEGTPGALAVIEFEVEW